MDFLNVGPWELVVVLIIAILVVGPKRMVEIARKLGQLSRQLRDLSGEFAAALQAEVQTAERGEAANLEGIQKELKDVEDAIVGAPQAEKKEVESEEA